MKMAMDDRREWPRYAAEKSFSLAANIDGKVVPCTVADVSLGGARLVFEAEIPDGHTIELSHPEVEPVHCAQLWRADGEIGIEFDFSENSLSLISVCIRNMVDLEQHPQAPI